MARASAAKASGAPSALVVFCVHQLDGDERLTLIVPRRKTLTDPPAAEPLHDDVRTDVFGGLEPYQLILPSFCGVLLDDGESKVHVAVDEARRRGHP